MKKLIFKLVFVAVAVFGASAQSSLIEQESGTVEELDLDTELLSPKVPDKAKDYVKAYMQQIAKDFYADHYEVETMRKGEVIVVTIPTDNLFAPNETSLMTGAANYLDRFSRFLSKPDMFKVVMAAHSDDTGSESYTHDLTESRLMAIFDYYDGKGIDTDNAAGFPMGATDPVKANISRENRMANRRLEIYIVPETGLIDSAKNQKK